jgi:hypothetical protein
MHNYLLKGLLFIFHHILPNTGFHAVRGRRGCMDGWKMAKPFVKY